MLVMCECVCYCANVITVSKQYVHVCVCYVRELNNAFCVVPNPFACSVMNIMFGLSLTRGTVFHPIM